jgi:hypothetical protein
MRAIAWGALLAFPALVAGFVTGFYWDGETTEGVELGVLLWPIWIAYSLVPVRGLGWICFGPVVQWFGYAVLVYAVRMTYRGFEAVVHKDRRRMSS